MTSLVSDAAAVAFGGRSPWPSDTKLYQPYEVEQILLADFASCLSVKAFLKMCDLAFTGELRTNAQYMSPSGKVPFIQVGKMIVSEFEPIVAFVGTKGHCLHTHLTDGQRAEMKAYMSLVNTTLLNTELWVSWCDKKVAMEISKPRYSYPFAWPLNVLLPLLEQRRHVSVLAQKGWSHKSFSQVCDEVRTCCQALSEKLAEQDFFFGEKPTELDALVFGHLYTLLSTQLPRSELAEIVYSFPNLSHFCTRVDNVYMKEIELQRDSSRNQEHPSRLYDPQDSP